MWTRPQFHPCQGLPPISHTLYELYRVLHKPSIQKHFSPSEDEIVEYLETIKEKAIITPNLCQIDRIKKDPTDNKFLVSAIEAKADFIVSGDKHLKEIKQFQGIKIVDAKSFVEMVRRAWYIQIQLKKKAAKEKNLTAFQIEC